MARAAKSRAKKSNVISLDFEGVESGGGGFKIPEGEYLMKVIKVEDTESDAGNSMFKWTFEGQEKKAKGKKFYLYTVYDPPDSLWKLKSLLEALGTEVPDGALDLDLDEMVDLELIGQVGDEEYQGKTTSKLQDFSPVDGDGDGGEEEVDEDEKPAKGAKKVAKKGKTKELEAVSADEVKGMDDDDMQELVEKYELDVDLSEHKTPRRKASAIVAALEEKELLATD
jgi:hypothetical protein